MSEAPKQNAIVERVPVRADSFGLVMTSLDEMWRYAEFIARSAFKPKGLENAESILVAMDYGAGLGMNAIQAIQNIAVINGRPCVWGDMMLAICQRSPVFDHSVFAESVESDGDKMVATCTVRRKGVTDPCVRSFSWADAVKARLAERDTYKMYPKRMLQMRARAFALRDTFADVLKGLYAREELDAESFETSAAVVGPVKRAALPAVAQLEELVGPVPEESPPRNISDAEAIALAADGMRRMGFECAGAEAALRAVEETRPDGELTVEAYQTAILAWTAKLCENEATKQRVKEVMTAHSVPSKKAVRECADVKKLKAILDELNAIEVENG